MSRTNLDILFQCWCVFFTRLRIYKDKVEIAKFFGISVITIPVQKIASVNNSIMGITLETTGGGKTELVQPWSSEKRKEAIKIVLKLLDSN